MTCIVPSEVEGQPPASIDLSPPTVWELDPRWLAIDFVSDLHLAEDTPQTVATFGAYLQHTEADAVMLLGDIFEVWVGDDCLLNAADFEARCSNLLSHAAALKCLAFMVGNRDFLLQDAARQSIGLRPLHDPGQTG